MSGDDINIRTGLFFGSFNPIHNGHLGIARYLLREQYCEELWFVVSPRNPFKVDQELLPEEDRLDLVEQAIANESGMRACDLEFTLPRPSYTVDTLKLLIAQFPERNFMLLMGGDNLGQFRLWKEHEWIAAHVSLLVYPRPGVTVDTIDYPDVIFVDAPLYSFSSTELRRKIAHREDIESWVPPSILESVWVKYQKKSK